MMRVEYCLHCGRTYFYYKYRCICPQCKQALHPIERDVEKFIQLSEKERTWFIKKLKNDYFKK